MKKLLILIFVLFGIIIFSNFAFAVVEITIEYPEACTENWSCTEWSECVDGVQTRKCIDSNNCGTTVNKPDESRSCICTENWSCTGWSACVGGVQTRTCTDLNDCGTTFNKPSESRDCTIGGGGGGVTPESEGEINYGLLILIILVLIVLVLIVSIIRGKGY